MYKVLRKFKNLYCTIHYKYIYCGIFKIFTYRRSMSSWSIDGVCAVVNMACGILEGEFANRLRNRLRQGYPAGYLDLTQAYNALLPTSIQHGRLQTSDTELARLTFLVKLIIILKLFNICYILIHLSISYII